ncbi:MAG: glycosyltransferase family 2 protein [Candidatus Hodarchaeales archaeon]
MIVAWLFLIINIVTAILIIPQNIETFYLVLRSKIGNAGRTKDQKHAAGVSTPEISIQLPLYNEGNNINGLLKAILSLTYPKNKLEVLILDDSDNEEDKRIIRDEVRKLESNDYKRVEIIRRSTREGHKAGNLINGLLNTECPLVAVFDADFRPQPSFLRSTLPVLLEKDENAAVQVRWTCSNEKSTLVTRFQAQGVRHNFATKKGRQQIGAKIMINGSGFLIRKRAIEDVNGWETYSLTEDLDLSIKLQDGGYKIKYLEDETCQQELVRTLPAFSRQQQRWVKGYSQCLKKHWRKALRDKYLFFMLTIYFVSLLAIINIISLCVVILTRGSSLLLDSDISWMLFFIYALVSLSLGLNYLSYLMVNAVSVKQFFETLVLILLMAVIGLGISFRLAVKNLSGLIKKGGTFNRSIKSGQLVKEEVKAPFIIELILLVFYLISSLKLWTDYGFASIGIQSYLWLFIAGTAIYVYSALKINIAGLRSKGIS